MNPLLQLEAHGQSIWLDFIKRDFLRNGKLKALVDELCLKGVTSNPAIFEKAIGQGTEYDAGIRLLAADPSASTQSIYEHLAIEDIQEAADILKPVYDKTSNSDGYVSLEVSPFLAHDHLKTVDEARQLWKEVNRPNVMIKVPATDEGILAIRTLIEDGININVTLLFSKQYYEKAAMAYIEGLEARLSLGKPIDHISSVASFFISRIDSHIDKALMENAETISEVDKLRRESLLGKAAIANAKITYNLFKDIYSQDRWKKIQAAGGKKQRLLWASTSTKSPKYRDVLYVEELIGKDTVNTLPPATLDAFSDHGIAKNTLESDLSASHEIMVELEKQGLDFEKICLQLTDDGVKLFADAFEMLLVTIEKKRKFLITGKAYD